MAEGKSGTRTFYWVLGVVGLAGAGLLGWQVMNRNPVSIPANVQVLAADTAGFRGYTLGSPDAPVEIVEYADYQCPGCAYFELMTMPDVKSRLIDAGKVHYVYRDFPLDQLHKSARIAAHAAACADEQGKYWPVHSLIFQGQPDWSRGNAGKLMRGYAEAAQLDLAQYDACMSSAKYAGRIEASRLEGEKLGVSSTPTLFVGGRLYPNLRYDDLRKVVDSLIAAKQPS